MPRALGDLTLDEYVDVVRTGRDSPPESVPSPRPASSRRGKRMFGAAALASCVVLAFTAGTFQEKRNPGGAQMGDAYQLDPALWPEDPDAQTRAVVAAQKQGRWLTDQLLDVALRRPVKVDTVRGNALASTLNIARKAIESLQACEAAGVPVARDYLDKISDKLNQSK